MKYRFIHLRETVTTPLQCDEETVEEEPNAVAMDFLSIGVFPLLVQT